MEKGLERGVVAKGNPLPLDGQQRMHIDLGPVTKKRLPWALLLFVIPLKWRRHVTYPQQLPICGVEMGTNARSF